MNVYVLCTVQTGMLIALHTCYIHVFMYTRVTVLMLKNDFWLQLQLLVQVLTRYSCIYSKVY